MHLMLPKSELQVTVCRPCSVSLVNNLLACVCVRHQFCFCFVADTSSVRKAKDLNKISLELNNLSEPVPKRRNHVHMLHFTLVSHLGLLQRSVCTLPVDHTEGDTLGFRGERPGDSGTRTAHGDGDGAVTAGLDEKLSGAVPKP